MECWGNAPITPALVTPTLRKFWLCVIQVSLLYRTIIIMAWLWLYAAASRRLAS